MMYIIGCCWQDYWTLAKAACSSKAPSHASTNTTECTKCGSPLSPAQRFVFSPDEESHSGRIELEASAGIPAGLCLDGSCPVRTTAIFQSIRRDSSSNRHRQLMNYSVSSLRAQST